MSRATARTPASVQADIVQAGNAPARNGVPRGLAVYCAHDLGAVGRTDGFINTPERGKELLVRSGWWEPVVRRLPWSDIYSQDDKAVHLKIDRDEFLKRPAYLSDEDLLAAVFQALLSLSPPRYTNIRYEPARTVELQAHHGVVRLYGHIANELHRRETVSRVAVAPGVVAVEDRLITDEQLVNAVALAMLSNPELQPSRVRVSANLGDVVLEGELDSERDIELAVKVAAKVPGVISVENRLCVNRMKVDSPPDLQSEVRKLVLVEPAEVPRWRRAGELRLRPPARPGRRPSCE
jgi:hypothetical protein